MFLIQPNRLIISHLITARGRVMERCEVKEKTWGNRAVAFISRMQLNRERMYPNSLFLVFPKVKATSLNRKLRNFLFALMAACLVVQTWFGSIITPSGKSNHPVLKLAEEGSKIENKLFIMEVFLRRVLRLL